VQERAVRYIERLAAAGVAASVGSRGDSYATQSIMEAGLVGTAA
jgi:hypothetical protein